MILYKQLSGKELCKLIEHNFGETNETVAVVVESDSDGVLAQTLTILRMLDLGVV